MLRSLYTAATGMEAQTLNIDVIANNLANASTVGFRAERNVFSSVLATAGDAAESPFSEAVNRFGILSGTTIDQSQGALEKTGNELDLGIEGSGYFVVQTADGPMYTRNGAFQVSSHGQLVTASGDAVMGDRGVINILPGPVSISADGTISSNGAVEGKLRLVEFPPDTAFKSMGNTYYSAPVKSAQPATNSNVRQGMLESSNVNPVEGMIELVSAQRTAEMMQRTLSMLNNDMDKTAAQDLPKVG